MQQTDKYKLNLIEKDDVFSPDPLNENARRLEEAIAAEAAAQDQARAADIAALDQRLQVFEARRFACGTYQPKGGGLDVILGFRPAVVFIMAFETFLTGALFSGVQSTKGGIIDNGFHVNSSTSSGTITNGSYTFAYIAFG